MKRYWLFGGEYYYAKGGLHDFVTESNNLSQLNSHAQIIENYGEILYDTFDWWHIVDIKTMKILTGSTCQAHGAEDLEPED